MDRAGKERVLARIAWGKVRARIDLDGSAQVFVLRPPTEEERARAAIVYDEQYESALAQGMMANAEAIAHAIDTGKWSEQDDATIEGLRSDIEKLVRGMLGYLLQNDRLEVIRKALRRAESALTTKLLEREALHGETAETYARMRQQWALVGMITEDDRGRPMWPTIEAFESCENTGLVQALVDFYFVGSRFPTRVIREIARSDPWRTVWMAAKHTGFPFASPPTRWSEDQRELVRWSQVYDAAFESLERPSQRVIEDDDLFDSWLLRQHEEIDRRTRKKEADDLLKAHRGTKKGGRQEVFILTDRQGAKDVYDMNDPKNRASIRRKQQIIAGRGKVREAELPESQAEMRAQIVAAQREHVQRGKRRNQKSKSRKA